MQNWETGIFCEARILERKLTLKEDRSAIRFDPASMLAVPAQAGIGAGWVVAGSGRSEAILDAIL